MGPRNRRLVGQIALDLELLDRAQLQQCIDLQAGQVSPKPLGVLLIETGLLTPEKLTQILEEQKRRLQEELPYTPAQRGAVAFGRLVVERGHAKQEAVNEALRAQQDLADRVIDGQLSRTEAARLVRQTAGGRQGRGGAKGKAKGPARLPPELKHRHQNGVRLVAHTAARHARQDVLAALEEFARRLRAELVRSLAVASARVPGLSGRWLGDRRHAVPRCRPQRDDLRMRNLHGAEQLARFQPVEDGSGGAHPAPIWPPGHHSRPPRVIEMVRG